MHDVAAKRDYSGGMPLSVSYRAALKADVTQIQTLASLGKLLESISKVFPHYLPDSFKQLLAMLGIEDYGSDDDSDRSSSLQSLQKESTERPSKSVPKATTSKPQRAPKKIAISLPSISAR